MVQARGRTCSQCARRARLLPRPYRCCGGLPLGPRHLRCPVPSALTVKYLDRQPGPLVRNRLLLILAGLPFYRRWKPVALSLPATLREVSRRAREDIAPANRRQEAQAPGTKIQPIPSPDRAVPQSELDMVADGPFDDKGRSEKHSRETSDSKREHSTERRWQKVVLPRDPPALDER